MIAGVLASLWMLFPSGHFSSEQVAEHQPVALAAMEGLFESERQPASSSSASPTWRTGA